MRCGGRRWISHRARDRRASATLLAAFAALSVLAGAAPAHAQGLPPARPAPAADPRRGPRLEYTRGPAECLPEAEFRSEVAIAARDGVDHLHAGSPDVVRVRFEKIPRGRYRATIEYTDAAGTTEEPEVQTSYNCEILARWVASSVSETIPRAPPSPAPTCPSCPEPTCPACPACRVCDTSRPSVPRPVPLTPPPWRMDLSVGLSTYVMMTAFLTGDVGPAMGLGVGAGGEVVSVNAELRFVFPSRTYAVEPIPGATSSFPQEFDLSQFSALLVPCARYKYLVGCGVAQLGGLFMQNARALLAGFTFGFGPRLGFEVPFAERFAVFGFGEVIFSPIPTNIIFDLPDPQYPDLPPANTHWRQSVASAFFGAGVSVKFR